MNKRIKILSLLFAVMMIMTAFTLTAYATDEVIDSGTDTTPVDPVDPTPVDPDPVDPVDPVTPTTAPDNGSDSSVVTPTTAPDDNSYVETPTTNGYVDYYDDDEFYYYDEDAMASSIENSAGSVSDYTDLYDTSDIDLKALEEEEWANIVLDTSSKNTDVSDFSAIKDNTDNNDDGQWIIYAGVILIALSLIGILYFIIATVTYKKKLKKLKAREQRQRSHSSENRARDDYGDYSDYPTASDYNKNYSGRKRYASSGMGYAERKRLNADTAEIDLPKKYRARH